MNIKEEATKAIELATRHAWATDKPMKSSALLCIDDANNNLKDGTPGAYVCALYAAERSMRYSIGIMHPDHAATLATFEKWHKRLFDPDAETTTRELEEVKRELEEDAQDYD